MFLVVSVSTVSLDDTVVFPLHSGGIAVSGLGLVTGGQFVVRTNGPRSIYASSPISSRNIQQCRCDGVEALAPPGLDSPVDQLLYTRRCPSPDTFAPPLTPNVCPLVRV